MSTDPWFGKGYGFVVSSKLGNNSSYKIKLLDYGIVGCMLIWGTLLLSVLKNNFRNKEIMLYIIVFFASIYQRPNIMTLPYLVLLTGGIECIKAKMIYTNSMSEIEGEKKE
jgi:hypothetical protein